MPSVDRLVVRKSVREIKGYARCAWRRNQEDKQEMTTPLYRSKVRIQKLEGPLRHAYIEPFDEAIEFGVHGPIAEHYGRGTADPIATTLDYVVAAAGG